MAFVIGAGDKNKQEDGIWVDYANSRFLVAYSKNAKYTRAITALRKPYEHQINKGKLDNDTMESILYKAMAQGILLDWEGVIGPDGKEAAYSQEMAEEALKGDPDFREFILSTAENFDAFKREDIKVVTKK